MDRQWKWAVVALVAFGGTALAGTFVAWKQGYLAEPGQAQAPPHHHATPVADKKPAPDKKAAAARFEQCRAVLKKEAAGGVLHDLDWKPGQEPYVVVGPAYALLHAAQKQALADYVDCFLAAGEHNCIGFSLRDWRTEKPVARYSLCRLSPAS